MPAGNFFGKQSDGGFTGRGDFSPHVLRPDIQIHQMVFAVLVFLNDLAFAESGIADNIQLADFHIELLQEAVIAHPVGQGMSDPGNPVGAVIVSRVNPQFPGNIIVRVYPGNRL